MTAERRPPRGVWVPAAFFAVGGVLEVACAVYDAPPPLAFWPIWDALGRAILHVLLAAGLLYRLSVCRFVALIYCVAMIATYAAALGLAFAGAPVQYPASVVLQSLYQVPSCVLLVPYLRSEAAALLFSRPLFGA